MLVSTTWSKQTQGKVKMEMKLFKLLCDFSLYFSLCSDDFLSWGLYIFGSFSSQRRILVLVPAPSSQNWRSYAPQRGACEIMVSRDKTTTNNLKRVSVSHATTHADPVGSHSTCLGCMTVRTTDRLDFRMLILPTVQCYKCLPQEEWTGHPNANRQ